MGKIIIIYGLPGAGKTTLSNMLCKKIKNSVKYSNDIVRKDLGYPKFGSKYTEKVYKYISNKCIEAVKNEYIPIVDATFYSKKYRDTFFKDISNSIHIILIHISTPLSVCRERVKKREDLGHYSNGIDNLTRFDTLIKKIENWNYSDDLSNYSLLDIEAINHIWKLNDTYNAQDNKFIHEIIHLINNE